MRAIVNASGRVHSKPMGLSGLGLINSAWCDSFEQAVETLGEAVRRGTDQSLTSPAFVQAKGAYEAETSFNIFGRTPVGLTNCEAQTARLVGILYAVNKELKTPVPVPPSIEKQYNDAVRGAQPPEPVPTWVKLTVIGGISVVGVIALAYVTGQVAPLLRAFKR